jgi:hypothetical protein
MVILLRGVFFPTPPVSTRKNGLPNRLALLLIVSLALQALTVLAGQSAEMTEGLRSKGGEKAF